MSVSNTTAPVIGCGSTAELQQQIAALSAELAASREREARMRAIAESAIKTRSRDVSGWPLAASPSRRRTRPKC